MNGAVKQGTTTRVVFRADASLEIGTGHVMRCLALAEGLAAEGAECHFVCRQHPGNLIDAIKARGNIVHPLPMAEEGSGDSRSQGNSIPVHAHWLGSSWQQDAATCRTLIERLAPEWLVVDHYGLDARWEEAVLSASGPRGVTSLLVIDDLADRPHRADLLLDQNLGRDADDYLPLVPAHCGLLMGPQYALLRPEFSELREFSLVRRQQAPLERLLISLGGIDKDNATGKVLEALKVCDLPGDTTITVVMGGHAPWRDEVRNFAARLPWTTEIVENVNDMARRMAEADLAIGAAGSTSWERCCLGLPALVLVLAENQRPVARALDVAGAAICVESPVDIEKFAHDVAALQEPAMLRAMSASAAAVTEGKGVRMVCRAMAEQRADV